jgi:hypothetical protein
LLAAVELLTHLLDGTTPLSKPDSIPQYRVVTPLLNLQAFLLLLAVVSSPRMRGRIGIACGSCLLAICTYLYFYYWTTAVAALALYSVVNFVLAVSGTPSERQARLDAGWFAVMVLAGGLFLSAPAILSTASAGSDPALKPILERISKGYHLLPGSAARSSNLRNYWVWAKLAFGLAGVLALGVRRIGLLWCATLAGYLLANSAIVTGLEFENFHWAYCHFVTGEVMTLVCLGQWLDRAVGESRAWLRALWLAPAGLLAIAVAWRPYEALTAPEPVSLSAALEELRPLVPALSRLSPEFVLTGPPPEVYVALLMSRCSLLNHGLHFQNLALIPDHEVHERDALDAWLRGLDRETYERMSTLDRFGFTEAGDPRWPLDAIRRERVDLFRSLIEGDANLLQKYRVDGLLRRTEDGAPPANRLGQNSCWKREAGDSRWTLWV